jgi:hypothetical protein
VRAADRATSAMSAGARGNLVPLGGAARAAMRAGLALPAAVVAMAGAYWFVLRPWHVRWGATASEVESAWPGDHLIPHPRGDCTHAITIHRPAAAVWPWLVQMGQGRGGFYSYAWLENLLGCRMENAGRIMPEHQRLQVGDAIPTHPSVPPLTVAILEPARALVLAATQAQDGFEVVSGTWGFFLRDLGGRAARLVVRTRWTWGPGLLRWIGHRVGLEPAHFVMERRMLLGIKRRAESAAGIASS